MEKDEDMDIKKIDSFLIIIDRNTSRKGSCSSSWISLDGVHNSSILERSPDNVLDSFGPSTPLSSPSLNSLSPEKTQRFKKKNNLKETILKCEETRSRCQNILKKKPSSIPKNRAHSNDKVESQKLSKKGVRYLNYLERMGKQQQRKLRHKTNQQETEIKPSNSLPQLRVQPMLLTVLNKNSCFNFRLLKSVSRHPKSELYLGQQLNTKILYSIKIFDKFQFQIRDINRLTKQLKKQMFLNHPNIIKLHQVLTDRSRLYALFEPGMIHDMASKLKQTGPMPEKEVRSILKQLCNSLEYLHKSDVLHLQLRLENIYLEQNVVKLAGFEHSMYLPLLRKQKLPNSNQQVKEIPDHCSHVLDTKKDIWDVGILTYELMFGKLPIFIHTQDLCEGTGIYYPEEVTYSSQLKQFIDGCLQQNPSKRFSMRQMNQHTFLKGVDKYRWTTF